MDEKNNNFEFSGFAENDSLEVPEETEIPNIHKRKNPLEEMLGQMFKGNMKDIRKEMGDITPDMVKNMLSDDEKGILDELSQATGKDENDILNSTINGILGLLSGDKNGIADMMANMLGGDDDCDHDCAHCPDVGDCDDANVVFELSKPEYLHPETFGSLECISDPDIYDNFLKKFGNDSTSYISSLTEKHLTDLTAQIPFNQVKNMLYMNHSDKFILFYMEMDNPKLYGFYGAVYESEKDKFELYIPEFQNSLDIEIDEDGNKTVSLYDPEESEAFFDIDKNNNATFAPLQIPLIEMAINFVLAPKNRVIISPHQFGTIKNIISSPSTDSRILQIGNITSNESPAAVLLKKDAELDLNETTFPLYIDFGITLNQEDLIALSQIFSKVDFNNCKLFDNIELRYTSSGKLYVEVDLGEF